MKKPSFNKLFSAPFAVFTAELNGAVLCVEPCQTRRDAEALAELMKKSAQMFNKLMFIAERID